MEAHRNKDWERRYRAAARAVRTTKEMIKGFIDLCVENGVEFVCSPYEADAQLGYMYKKKQIDFVISEDSDLLLYGVREVFYKLDVNAGGQGTLLVFSLLSLHRFCCFLSSDFIESLFSVQKDIISISIESGDTKYLPDSTNLKRRWIYVCF